MVRLLHVYYPVRTLALLLSEALVIGLSFLCATLLVLGPDAYLALNYESGTYKIAVLIVLTLLCSYYLDLYEPKRLPSKLEIYFRLMTVVGILSLILATVAYFFPEFEIGHDVLLLGLVILTVALMVWRRIYAWIIRQPLLREQVYILGSGERAYRAVEVIQARDDLGMAVVGWEGATGKDSCEDFTTALASWVNRKNRLDRIIVALDDRRGKMPVRELLNLRLAGTRIDDVATIFEQIFGKIELEGLHPSAMIFGDGFQVKPSLLLARRLVSVLIAGAALLILLPVIPLIALAVRLSSPGPVFFQQQRVGRGGEVFSVYKFRTMRRDAESATGAVWAQRNDPRVTRVGKFLRKTRLDEIPQLWNVLKGDMGFVGPRPERPEFVQWLTEQIPYYNLRHIVRPGLTGWAQVRYQYGATLEETRQKLEYDLYYIKHMSVGLDLLIIFDTLKTILLRRGAQ